ncbi:hypothetical protein HU200_035428 [Digitaria exilis]|uniref:Uncharacterized protein n=1 Tax=Digitaria exilis TaxID=1010633 RepID=A0A835BHK7_9POAL|nr:hypothetical protein HU200_035428 [Digitaria exilis]
MVITCEHVISSIIGADSLKVTLYGSSVNLDATVLFTHKPVDLAVLSVVVENVKHYPVVTFSSADKPPGTIVVLVGNFHPADALSMELNESKLFPLEPSAYGGTILGPPKAKGRQDILINHNCHGMKRTSGSPLICNDTSTAIGVYAATRNQIDEAVATETVNKFLQLWLGKKVSCLLSI